MSFDRERIYRIDGGYERDLGNERDRESIYIYISGLYIYIYIYTICIYIYHREDRENA